MAKTESKTGNRYTDEKKKMVVMWYNSRAKHNPRGAIKETLAHFKISYTAFRGWLEKFNGSTKRIGDTTKHTGTNNKATVKAFKALHKLRTREVSVMEKIIRSLT